MLGSMLKHTPKENTAPNQKAYIFVHKANNRNKDIKNKQHINKASWFSSCFPPRPQWSRGCWALKPILGLEAYFWSLRLPFTVSHTAVLDDAGLVDFRYRAEPTHSGQQNGPNRLMWAPAVQGRNETQPVPFLATSTQYMYIHTYIHTYKYTPPKLLHKDKLPKAKTPGSPELRETSKCQLPG